MPNDTCVIQTIDSPIGPLVAGACRDGVCLLEFSEPARLERQMASVRRRVGCDVTAGPSPLLDLLREELAAYFAGRLRTFSTPVVTRGTAFQERVWAELRRIPYGATRSYEEIAVAVATVTAQRAVGTANGMNPVAIVVPCHRVINKNGKLGGYGGLLWRKEVLLRLEGVLAPEQATLFRAPQRPAGVGSAE